MYYVLGHDENGKLIAMTNLAFADPDSALVYADSCNQNWTPFVVGSLVNAPSASAGALTSAPTSTPTREGLHHEEESESQP